MASPFSGRAGRLAAMWAAGQATQGAGQVIDTLRAGEQKAGDFLTGSYETGLENMEGGYGAALQALQQSYQNAPDELRRGRDYGVSSISQGYDDAARSAAEYGDRGVNSLSSGINSITGARDAALGYGQQSIDQTRGGYAAAMGNLNRGFGEAIGTQGELYRSGKAGYDMLGNALGLGGAAGNAAARGAFQQGPGYEWQVEQTTDAAQRAANRVGGLYGGNTLDITARLGSNLANQEWGNWIKNLQPYQSAAQTAGSQLSGLQAGQGQAQAGLNTAEAAAVNSILGNQGKISQDAGSQIAGQYKNIADLQSTTGGRVSDLQAKEGVDVGKLYAGTGQQLGEIALNRGTSEAKLAGDYYSQIANLAAQYGGTQATLASGTAGNVASAQQAATNTTIGAGTQGLLAGNQAAANNWGAIMGGLGLGAGVLGAGLGGSGSLLSSIFK